ncbi:MAG: hypothetical protein IIA81_03340 [Thaumarchaeota archaeon]|nr:hypothetical protein [Nitrososphaerota archaeon]
MSIYDIINELEEIVKNGCQISEDLDFDLTFGQKVGNMYDTDLFNFLTSEFQTMSSVIELTNSGKFKDAFILLRTIFEMLLYFWLMVEAEIYYIPQVLTAKAENGKSAQENRDFIFERWAKKKREGDKKYQHIIKMKKIGNDAFEVIYRNSGLYGDSGEMIPAYYFLLQERYHPTEKLADLDSIKEGEIYSNDKIIKFQKDLYKFNFTFSSIIFNLLENKLISKPQDDYIKVHYNFLSKFVHPTKDAADPNFQSKRYGYPDVDEETIKELILLYLCRIQYLFFKIITDRFRKENKQAKIEKYIELMQNLNYSSKHFWFFDNEPTPFDLDISDTRKHLKKNIMKQHVSDTVVYYEDPLVRLKQFRG